MRLGEPLPAIVTQPSMKSVGASASAAGSSAAGSAVGGDLVEAADDAALVDLLERARAWPPGGCGTARSAGCGRAAR
jgi:hypothetical protein